VTPTAAQPGSSSLDQPDYWWFRARAELLHTVLGPYFGQPATILDVGSADGPSVAWMRGGHRRVTLDLFPRGLTPGEGVCGSAEALPFADHSFDVVAAFDVVEHCRSESLAMAELARVLRPGGRMLLSVPAYQWAWSDHDVQAGHQRRYTWPRLGRLVEDSGMQVLRATYAFGGVFPIFLAERARRRLAPPASGDTRLPQVSPRVDQVLMGLCAMVARVLRRRDLPFGSSVFLAAVKPG
jgi:SAM-dependent methyltransferase